ncbi:thiamine diphosphokinase [Mesorhizobium koreense]|jgi:thiamine pyrophosphokinase|uniref:thiamine diphosphokinase n=1 Tax=Mesorhizobium koreense TaxID=3074855 RepID=UPI00287B636B|nr:thiamine diphosphokinase [Mesorhizobium sp. WR6]
MSRFTILLGGDLTVTPRLLGQIADTHVVAADSGLLHADPLKIVPELWVGDFDSTEPDWLDAYDGIERMVYSPDKDHTDGEIAVGEALSRGATSLVLAGAFGGPRADHAFLHMALGVQLAERGVSVLLTSGAQEGSVLPHARAGYDYPPGTMFSILGFSELRGLTVEGAKWPLDDVVVPFGSSLTISNVVKDGLVVRLREGRALLVATLAAT